MGTVSVVVSRECQWSARSGASWVTITSGAEGQGNGSVAYRVAENADPVARQASLVVVERQVSVAQQAAPCRFDVALSSPEPVPQQGGELVVQLRTHAACSWTAASQVEWAAVSPASGRGDGTVRASVGPNPGPERRIDLIVAGQHVTALQRARLTPPSPVPTPPAPPAPPPSPGPAPGPSPGPGPQPAPDPPPLPTPGRKIDLNGRVQGLAGVCPVISFGLEGRTVFTTPDTKFKGMSCSRIENGLRVKVEGREMSDSTVRADEIRRDDDD